MENVEKKIVKARVKYPSEEIRYINFKGVKHSIKNGELATSKKFTQHTLKLLEALNVLIDIERETDDRFYVVYLENGKPCATQSALTNEEIEKFLPNAKIINKIKLEPTEEDKDK